MEYSLSYLLVNKNIYLLNETEEDYLWRRLRLSGQGVRYLRRMY